MILCPTRDVLRSALRYFGGKWALAPWIIGNMPPHRIYVEPFGGAASVLLRKPRSKIEVYNDADDEIVYIFRIIQDPIQCRALMRLLRRTPYARREFELAFASTDDPLIRAQRAIVRTYLSFHHSALFDFRKTTFDCARHRSNKSCGKMSLWASYPRHLASIFRRLRGVLSEHGDALDVIRQQDAPDTLYFVDPPYVASTRNKAVHYRHELTDAQHVALLTLLQGVQGKVMISGYANDIYDDLLAGWTRLTRDHYASAGAAWKPSLEVLWIKP
jgi:DNA adenine methylase